MSRNTQKSSTGIGWDEIGEGGQFTVVGRHVNGKLVVVKIPPEWRSVRRRPKPYVVAVLVLPFHTSMVFMVEHGCGQRTAHVKTTNSDSGY